MPISSLKIKIRKNIVKMGNLFAVKARRKASSSNVPAVPKAIEVSTPLPLGKYGSRIEIKVNQEKMKGKDGRDISGAEWAYEEGSGLYGEKGKKYRIEPKKASVLAFPGKKSFLLERSGQSLLPLGAKGTMFFEHVDHPGVGERPFFKTTLAENRDRLTEISGEGIEEITWELVKEAWNVR